jgi:uncharacterized phiE125 gp8 family phage protein
VPLALRLQSAPTEEPISLEEALAQCKVDTRDEDALFTTWIKSERQRLEEEYGRAFVTQTWDWQLDAFPGCNEPLIVPRPPLVSVSSISYLDSAGALQVMSTSKYSVDTVSDPGRICLAYGESWPLTRPVPAAVSIRFVAGYGAAAAVPDPIRRALLLLVEDARNHRGRVVTGTIVNVMATVEALMAPYKTWYRW